MNVIERAKHMILSPAREWDIIASEQPDTGKIITGYVLPLAGAAAVAAFVGYMLIGVSYFGVRYTGFNFGISQAISILIGGIVGVFISAFVIDALAPTFSSEKNIGRSVQLVAYSYTAVWVGGLLAILPFLAWIGGLAGLVYGLYLLYTGLPKLKKTPADKQVGYFVVSLVAIVVVYFVIGWIMLQVLPGMTPYRSTTINVRY